MAADLDARGRAYLATLAGRRVTVVGMARSGVAAARLLVAAGARVTAVDAKPREALGAEVAALEALGVRLRLGPAAGAEGAADGAGRASEGAGLIVVSPGVPLDSPEVAAAGAAGVPVIGELELGWRAMSAEAVAITGTNGKTTTTALTGALIAETGRPVLVAGNIGTPLSAHALAFAPDGLVVCEVSSFQLETTEAFHPRVAAILNLTPDHLDRHRSLAAYADAKARIFLAQTADDCAVLNADDAGAAALAGRSRAPVLWFSRRRRLDQGVFVRDGWVVARLAREAEPVCPVAEIPLRGAHNLENVLAATACAVWLGGPAAAVRRAVGRFAAVAHRIEPVRTLDGVGYYNDSKGTNVDSTTKAIESFTEPIVLIAGGVGKGQDFAPLAGAARGRVAHAVVIGEDGPKIAEALRAEGIPVTAAGSLQDAVAEARARARAGAVVLLSPACASFDMFRSYEHRGDVFRDLVRALPDRGEAG
jgi:UDP-N-acetylmuramoylalanine--D-glutamate ligase